MTDTRAWDGFDLRPDDVIICTPPKAGTTWTQTIVLMLMNRSAELGGNPWQLAPWIDCAFRPHSRGILEEKVERRCIKTHSPLDGIGYAPEATYIVVQRHPVDVHFSLQRHVENMKDDWLAHLYAGDTERNFTRFLTHPMTDTGTDDTSLASIVSHYRSFRRWPELPNIHYFHYADLTRDLRGEIARLDDILETGCAPSVLDAITQATSFEQMKANVARNPREPEDSPFKDDAHFFASARSGKWTGRLDDEAMNRFEEVLSELLDPIDAAWLQWGETG